MVHEEHGVKACIASTYYVDLVALVTDFPSLFGASATIPSMLIHGGKELYNSTTPMWNIRTNTREANMKRDAFRDSITEEQREENSEEVQVMYYYDDDLPEGLKR